MSHRHLTEEQLIAAGSTGIVPPETVGCGVCRARHESHAQMLDEVSDTVTLAADAAFPPERLARQRARILARIERYGQMARIVTFPSSHSHRGPTLRPRPLRRWVAAAAAAGLFVGLVTGLTVRDIPSLHVSAFTRLAPSTALPPGQGGSGLLALRASTDNVDDDELLKEIELAVASSGPNALRAIEDVTPVAWEAH
jgi:hypothetical protein